MTRREKRFLAFSVVMGGVLFVPQSAYAMHIMEGYLPPAYCAAWGALCLPFLAAGVVRLRRTVQAQRKALLLLAMSGAFIFVISSLKLPSVTGSCSHMTGTGLAAILFGPAYAAVLGLIVLVFQAVLLAHGGDASHLPLDKGNLAHTGFSYAALGHIHKPELAPDFSYAYPGSLEPLDKTETGPHGMVVGEIQPASGQVISLEFVPVARTQYIPLVVHVTPSTTNGELCDRITDAVKERGMEHIYRFRIRGMRDPDITFDLEPLERRLQIVEAVDESEPQYDFCQLFAEHPSDMIGFYIQAFQKEDPSPIEKKALYYGIDALLRTTDERS